MEATAAEAKRLEARTAELKRMEDRRVEEKRDEAYTVVVDKKYGGAKPSTVRSWREKEPEEKFIVEVEEKDMMEVR